MQPFYLISCECDTLLTITVYEFLEEILNKIVFKK